MTAAVWSTPPDVCSIDFPAKTLIRFLYNHHLLQITGKPSWLTIKGGRQAQPYFFFSFQHGAEFSAAKNM
jgi:predicted NAD/FAD-binding protein